MTQRQFSALLDRQVDICLNLLRSKGAEYAPDLDVEADVGDRLAHFKQAAALQDVSIEQACFGMFVKQIVSIADMCKEPEAFDLERWNEKLADSINYLLILSAIVNRESAEEIAPSTASKDPGEALKAGLGEALREGLEEAFKDPEVIAMIEEAADQLAKLFGFGLL